MSARAGLSNLIRSLGLLPAADRLRFHGMRLLNRSRNRRFRKEYPGVALPPDPLMYETFRLDYRKYYVDSRETAAWLVERLQAHGLPENASLLDWGCGPGRIIRHLPSLLGSAGNYHGCDPNAAAIAWCQASLPGLSFTLSGITPPLPFPDKNFDAIYGISVLTHLPDSLHPAWLDELGRVLKPGGILFLTTQGRAFRGKLSRLEQRLFDSGQAVIRGKTRSGHRTFSAFNPPEHVRSVISGYTLLEHLEPTRPGQSPQQDTWLLRKKRREN